MSTIYSLRISIKEKGSSESYFSNHEQAEKPLNVEAGKQQIFPAIEKELPNMKAGESKIFSLPAVDAFGELNDEAIVAVPLENIPQKEQQTNNVVRFEVEDGHEIVGVIQKIEESNAIIDFNHPLAGKEVEVDVLLENIQK